MTEKGWWYYDMGLLETLSILEVHPDMKNPFLTVYRSYHQH